MGLRFGVLGLIFILIASSGCKKSELPPPDSVAPGVEPTGPPVTDEEAKQFAAALEKAFLAHDAGQMEEVLRTRDLLDRVVSDIGLSADERNGFTRGAERDLQPTNLGMVVLKTTENGGSYNLLRARELGGRQRVLFRLIRVDGGVNYHDFVLARYPDGKVGMEDVYLYLTGEMLSQSMRRLIIPKLLQSRDPKTIKAADDDLVNNLPKYREMMSAYKQNQFALAAEKYHELPRVLQENKTVLLIYVQAIGLQGESKDADYVRAMEKFRSLFPNDACIDLVSLDYYLLKKRYDDAHRALDRVNASLGGDPYLLSLKGDLHAHAGDLDAARKTIEEAIDQEPKLKTTYWSRIALALREKNHADTLRWLKKLVETCDESIADLIEAPAYADFVKSPQYREWLEWYRNHKKR